VQAARLARSRLWSAVGEHGARLQPGAAVVAAMPLLLRRSSILPSPHGHPHPRRHPPPPTPRTAGVRPGEHPRSAGHDDRRQGARLLGQQGACRVHRLRRAHIRHRLQRRPAARRVGARPGRGPAGARLRRLLAAGCCWLLLLPLRGACCWPQAAAGRACRWRTWPAPDVRKRQRAAAGPTCWSCNTASRCNACS
jgi:hypothetical protein